MRVRATIKQSEACVLAAVIVSLAFLFMPGVRGEEDSPFAHVSFQRSLQAGCLDSKGNLMAGMEVMSPVLHQGRLYACSLSRRNALHAACDGRDHKAVRF